MFTLPEDNQENVDKVVYQEVISWPENASNGYNFVYRCYRLIHACVFGQKVLIDCTYDEKMNDIEKRSTGRQIALAVVENRKQKTPFDLQLFNADFGGATFEMLEKLMPNVREKKNPMLISEHSFTTVYPKENLLYLSPDSDNDLLQYNPEDIYVVGALVDKRASLPFSLTKARTLGIRHARLPIDDYVKLKVGSHKRLNINVVIEILQSWKNTKDWNEAFKNISGYKIDGYDDFEIE